MSLVSALRRRRAIAEHEHTLRTNDALFQAGRELRREAQTYLNAGRPDLAQPYIEEALLFEAATTCPPGLAPSAPTDSHSPAG
jgi:hypothetical protein